MIRHAIQIYHWYGGRPYNQRSIIYQVCSVCLSSHLRTMIASKVYRNSRAH